MFRLLMPLNPGKENGYQPRFPAKPEARIRPEGWRFFAGTAPDLACQALAITLWQQKAIMPRAMGKGRKGVPEEKRRALQVVHLPLCPVSESRRRGATPATYVPVHVLPCTGAKITNREATPSYLFTRKIRGSRRPVPCHSHRIWQDAANCGFFAPPHPLRQLSRSQRLGNAPFLRLSRR